MLEMREREGSDVLGAREDPGRRGREASKHSAEVGIPQGRDAHRRSHSIQQKVGAAVRLSQEPSDEDHVAEFNCMRGWPPRRSAREKERWDTRGLAANNDHTGGVEGLSGPRRGRAPKTRRQNSSQRKQW